jgi:hypothetical protein
MEHLWMAKMAGGLDDRCSFPGRELVVLTAHGVPERKKGHGEVRVMILLTGSGTLVPLQRP